MKKENLAKLPNWHAQDVLSVQQLSFLLKAMFLFVLFLPLSSVLFFLSFRPIIQPCRNHIFASLFFSFVFAPYFTFVFFSFRTHAKNKPIKRKPKEKSSQKMKNQKKREEKKLSERATSSTQSVKKLHKRKKAPGCLEVVK
jgi:amino acid permease